MKDGPRLQDLIDTSKPIEVKVHEGFDYWVGENVEDPTGEVAAGLERANAAAAPTVRLESVDAAYWTQIGDRRYLRWVMPHTEDTLLDALARLHAAGSSALTEGSRLIGSFRALGVLAPVWELPAGHRGRRRREAGRGLRRRPGEGARHRGPADHRRARRPRRPRQPPADHPLNSRTPGCASSRAALYHRVVRPDR